MLGITKLKRIEYNKPGKFIYTQQAIEDLHIMSVSQEKGSIR